MRGRVCLEVALRFVGFTLAVLVAGLAHRAASEPLTMEAKGVIEGRLLAASLMSNAKAALRYCREADAAASKHDRDPFYNGAIAACVAFAEVHLKNREAACKARNHALHQLQSVRPGHPRHADAVEEIAAIRKHDALFGC